MLVSDYWLKKASSFQYGGFRFTEVKSRENMWKILGPKKASGKETIPVYWGSSLEGFHCILKSEHLPEVVAKGDLTVFCMFFSLSLGDFSCWYLYAAMPGSAGLGTCIWLVQELIFFKLSYNAAITVHYVD